MPSIDQKDSSALPVFVKPLQKLEEHKAANADAKVPNSFSQEVANSDKVAQVDEGVPPITLSIVDVATEQNWPAWEIEDHASVEGKVSEVSQSLDIAIASDAEVISDMDVELLGEQVPVGEDVLSAMPTTSTSLTDFDAPEIKVSVAHVPIVPKLFDEEIKIGEEASTAAPSQDASEGETVVFANPVLGESVQTDQILNQSQREEVTALDDAIIAPVQSASADEAPPKLDVEPEVFHAPIRPRASTSLEKQGPELAQKSNVQSIVPEDFRSSGVQVEVNKPLEPQSFGSSPQLKATIQPTIQPITSPIEAALSAPNDLVFDDIDIGRGLEQISMKDRLSAPTLLSQSTAQLNTAVARQIFGQLSAGLSHLGQGGIEIRLNPVELGRITIQILEGSLGPSANVLVEKPEVLDLLKRNENLLQSEFDGAGFESLSFTFGQQDHPDANQEPELSLGSSEVGSKHQNVFVEPTLIRTSADLDIRL